MDRMKLLTFINNITQTIHSIFTHCCFIQTVMLWKSCCKRRTLGMFFFLNNEGNFFLDIYTRIYITIHTSMNSTSVLHEKKRILDRWLRR